MRFNPRWAAATLGRDGAQWTLSSSESLSQTDFDILPGHVRSGARNTGASLLQCLSVLLDLASALQHWVVYEPLVALQPSVQGRIPDADTDHEQVLLQAVPGVI